jgi:rod shape determining protein RodA
MIRKFFQIDLLLFLPAVLLSAVGLLMIYSVSFDSDPSIFIRQLIYIFISIAVFFIVSTIDFKVISHLYPLWYILAVGLLVITFILGVESHGSVRWLDLGLFKIQGSEIAKPILALALASFFAKHPPVNLRNFLISAGLAAIPILLVFKQPDLGSAAVLGLIWVSMVFISGVNIAYLAAVSLSLLAAAPLLWSFLRGYQKTRILTFLNPTADPLGSSYSVVQALIALGSGQLTGRGLGRGPQSQLNFLPEEGTDFIFSSTGEELGFIGIILIIILSGFLIYRLLKIANEAKEKEASLFIFGAAFIIFFQFVINAGMNMGILPVTGITLPFVSFGGSSILAMFTILGLVAAARKKEQVV